MKLPQPFVNAMRLILKEEYQAFEASFDQEPYKAVRRNSLKIDKTSFEDLHDFLGSPVDWCDESYYIDDEVRSGKAISYHSVLYSTQ